MDTLKGKITKASESTNARFKRKKIRSMKREDDKIAEKLAVSEAKLELTEHEYQWTQSKEHPLNYILPIKTNA